MNSKQIIISIMGSIITIFLTVMMVQYLGYLLDPPWSQDGLDVVEAFHEIDENTLDVIVYGSSHAWKGCDTRVMCDEYGLAAYNYGCNWQAINTSLLFLEDSLRTQTPKVVCIETYLANNVLSNVDMDGQIYYTRAIPEFEGKWEYLKQCFNGNKKRYLSYFVPLIMFHDTWTAINFENYLVPDFQRWLDSRGFMATYNVNAYEMPDPDSFHQFELNENSIGVLNKIVSICKEKNIEIIFYTCPWAGEYNYSDALKKYADQNDCVYLDLFEHLDEMKFDGKKDLNDMEHVNANGAGKVARFLADYIVENYEVNNSVKTNSFEQN